VSLARVLGGEELLCDVFDAVWPSAASCSRQPSAGSAEVVRGIVHASAAVGVVAVTVLLSGCGQQDGVDLARQACGHVTISIKLYERAAHDATPGVRHANEPTLSNNSKALSSWRPRPIRRIRSGIPS